MYERFYRLRERPFALTPDLDYLYLSPNHRDALDHLRLGLESGAGFVVLTDPPGPWPGLGLYVAAGLYLGFYMRWVGRHDWRTVVALATVVPVITVLIFETWFLVPMPKGPIEAWFGY